MMRKQRSVEDDVVASLDEDRGEILDFEIAGPGGLVFDVHVEEGYSRKLLSERFETAAVVAARAAPIGAEAGDEPLGAERRIDSGDVHGAG